MNTADKLFFAIILSACIIGGCVYLGLSGRSLSESSNASSVKSSYKASVLQSRVASAKNGACLASTDSVVTKVIDGDTVVVAGGYHVRLLGIDADEKNYPCYDAAKKRLEELVLSKKVILEKDQTDVDQYGRCLRTLFLDGQNIDLQLVKEGLAVARFYAPDVRYRSEIAAAEQQAMENKIGCKWSK